MSKTKREKPRSAGDEAPEIGMLKGAALGLCLMKLSAMRIRHVMDMKNTPARAVRNMVQPAKVYGLASLNELLSRMP